MAVAPWSQTNSILGGTVPQKAGTTAIEQNHGVFGSICRSSKRAQLFYPLSRGLDGAMRMSAKA